ncbi:IS110 family transposase [Ferrimonas pelagia]|uniref:IS110 family transposase n=1 Tax=Ferrimonas pelagia TaxID=1177826 RepID=A0ABP9ECG4_9GAMM
MKSVHLNKYSAFVGIDWADQKHDICVQLAESDEREFSQIGSSPESISAWLEELHLQCQGKIAIAVELKQGPIVYALQQFDYVTIFPVEPTTLARYRETFSLSAAKDDPTDAQYALELMLRYPDKVKPLELEREELRTLKRLVESRRKFVNDRRRLANRLICCLKHYYPQILELFAHRDTDLFCEFILRWPSLQFVKAAQKRTIRHFFNKRGGPCVPRTELRIQALYQARELTDDWAVLMPHQLEAMALAGQLLHLSKAIRIYDKEVKALFNTMPDAELFGSLPGAGACLAPRLLVAFGEKRERFSSAEDVQQLAGIAPVTQRSGKKCWVHFRWQCSKFVRQSFVEWAEKSVNYSTWACAYYQRSRAAGKPHQVAVRALAFKWIRVLYRCWKSHTLYDEERYVQQLQLRGSPLVTG